MAGSLASVVGEQLAVLLTHSDEELVDGHGSVYGDFATEESLDVVLFDACWGVLGEQGGEAFYAHVDATRRRVQATFLFRNPSPSRCAALKDHRSECKNAVVYWEIVKCSKFR